MVGMPTDRVSAANFLGFLGDGLTSTLTSDGSRQQPQAQAADTGDDCVFCGLSGLVGKAQALIFPGRGLDATSPHSVRMRAVGAAVPGRCCRPFHPTGEIQIPVTVGAVAFSVKMDSAITEASGASGDSSSCPVGEPP